MNKIHGLIKFGKKEHLERLMNEGIIHFSPLSRFRNSKEPERGDKFEGALNIVNGKFTKIEANHPTLGKFSFIPAANSKGQIINFVDDSLCVFSCFAITEELFNEVNLIRLNQQLRRCTSFDSALVFKYPNVFFDKVSNALNREKLLYQGGLVSYLDFSQGELEVNLFQKNILFRHQSEHRILVKSPLDEPLILHTSPMNDISFLVSADQIFEMDFYAKREYETETVKNDF